MTARLLPLLLTLAACACDSRPGRFPLGFDRMRDQPRYDAYGRSAFFADGKVMQMPPGGTVATEPTESASELAAAVSATVAPEPITAEALARGRNRYDIFCAPCHDLDGAAGSPVATNMQLRHPPSLLEDRLRRLPAGRIYGVISEGYGLMPPYARQLPPAERWDVVAYVRALQLRSGVALSDLSPALRAEAGRALAGGAP